MISDKGLLFIEPSQRATSTPVIDDITRRMCAAFRSATRSNYAYCGFHICVCGASSTAYDYHLPNGALTNSLCVHYVAHHRAEVTHDQLARIKAFPLQDDEPTEEELQGPELIVLREFRGSVMKKLHQTGYSAWMNLRVDFDALCRALQDKSLEIRQDAEALLSILGAVKTEALYRVSDSIRHSHGDVRAWAALALRIPGWSREVWVAPLTGILQLSVGKSYDFWNIAMNLKALGPHAGALVPTLFRIGEEALGDRLILDAVLLALDEIGRIPGILIPATATPDLIRIARDSWYRRQLENTRRKLDLDQA